MVVLLVALTFATFLLLNWYWMRSRRKNATTAAEITRNPDLAPARTNDPGFLFHPGHTWVRLEEDGTATLGVTDVIAHLAGRLASVDLPPPGIDLARTEEAWTLNSANGRKLTQKMPLSGKVIAANHSIRKEPGRLLDDPYGAGWLLKTTIRGLGAALRDLKGGPGAQARLDEIRTRLATRLQPALGHAALDGGTWVRAFGDELDDRQWRQFKEEILGDADKAPPPTPHLVRLP